MDSPSLPPTQPDPFTLANEDRARAAAVKTIPRARAALRVAGMPKHLRYALRLRINHPTLSLSDLAVVAKTNKDTLAGQMRRAFEYADRHCRHSF